jgi:hypothetical protein
MLVKTAKVKIRNVDSQDTLVNYLKEKHSNCKEASKLTRIALDPENHFYLDAWAVSAYEQYGLNENYDGFEHEELEKAYPTFKGAWVCLDHQNWNESLAIGHNVDAVYMPDRWVRIVMAVNRTKAERRLPGLEQRITSGSISDTSMGAWCRESMCNVPKCANIASEASQFCKHVRELRGQILCNSETNWEPIRTGELNRGVMFFEQSVITDSEGADRNAKILAKLASVSPTCKTISAESLYKAVKTMMKTASKEEKVAAAQLLEYVMRSLDGD